MLSIRTKNSAAKDLIDNDIADAQNPPSFYSFLLLNLNEINIFGNGKYIVY